MTREMTRELGMTAPAFLPAATHSYLERAAESLREAITSAGVPERYAYAHVSALRATAALLAARAQPVPAARRGRQKNAWVLLTEVAPEFTEWASFFAAGPASGPPPRPGHVGRSPSGRPTTWSVTPTGSWRWWRPRWA